MEPKKKIKKFNGFKTKKKIEFISPGICDVHEPRLRYRYLMEFPLGDRMFSCFVDCELPSVRMNHQYSWGGVSHINNEWQPILVVLKDCVGDEDNTYLFHQRIREWLNRYQQYGGKINTTIFRLDSTGVVTDRWDLRGCFISDIHFSQTLDGDHKIEITLHYDYCNLNLGI